MSGYFTDCKVIFIFLYMVIISFGLIFDCSESKNNKGVVEDSSDTIIDQFPEKPPFNIKRPSNKLPDSLGGNSCNGYVALKVNMNDKGKILDYEIVSLKVKNNQNEYLINYLETGKMKNNDYPPEVRRYTNWVSEYLHKMVIEPKLNVEIEKINRLSFIIQFNKK